MAKYGGIQLLAFYKTQLDPKFLNWYKETFTNARMLYGHWPVECIDQDDEHYQKVVGEVGRHPYVWDNNPASVDLHEHTFGRNTNSVAIALAGFTGATTSNLGAQVAVPDEIREYVLEVAKVCINLNSPVANFMSHGEAADNIDQGPHPPYNTPLLSGSDALPYGPFANNKFSWMRWDLHVWIDPSTLKLYPPKGNIPHGTVYFPDWIRGEAILKIQELTKSKWNV